MSSPTGQLATSIPDFDPTMVINIGEQQLADYLAMRAQQILDQLRLGRAPVPALAAPTAPEGPAHHGGPIYSVDPTQLISPVINALDRFGSGQFPRMDHTGMLKISNTLKGNSGPLRQALGVVGQGWDGTFGPPLPPRRVLHSQTGAEAAAQATGLQNSPVAAAIDVTQADPNDGCDIEFANPR